MTTHTSKLEDLVVRTVAAFPNSILTRTKLVKLVFLADRRAALDNGSKITDVTYVRYDNGPYSDLIVEATRNLNRERIAVLAGVSKKGEFYDHEPITGATDDRLTSEERASVDAVLDEYSEWDTTVLVEHVERLDEVAATEKYGTIRLGR